MEVMAGDENTPCRLFDADGAEIKFATWANLDTGMVSRYVRDGGEFTIEKNDRTGNRELAQIAERFKAPLRIEKIKA